MSKNNIPYKTYLAENEMPKEWYNVRADMKRDIEAEKITPVVTETAPPETANNNFRELLDVLREKDSTIREMAEEIGMLKQTITQLKQDKSGRVSDASDSTVANAI